MIKQMINKQPKMQAIVYFILALIFSMGIITGCDEVNLQGVTPEELPFTPQPQGSQGAQAWIEFPQEGQILPNAPLPIVAYAADNQRVSLVSFQLNGSPLPAGPVKALGKGGSAELVRRDYLWLPEQEGEYLLEAQAQGDSGTGQTTYTRFCIVSCQPATTVSSTPQIVLSPTPTPAQSTNIIPVTITTTPPLIIPTTQAAPLQTQIEFWAAPPYINASQCSLLQWSITNAKSAKLNGIAVNLSGQQNACLCNSTIFTLDVTKLDNVIERHNVSVDVYGSCEAPQEEPVIPPTTEPPTEAPPPAAADTTPPTISNVSTLWEGCQIYGQASISDPSGVGNAKFFYNLSGEGWRSVWMSELGSGSWQTEIGITVTSGIDTPIGSMEYYVTASDSLGNENRSTTSTLPYTGCGGR